MSQPEHRTEGAPTLATVAAEAGVSRQTVSNALNSPELLRPDTLERVREAIARPATCAPGAPTSSGCGSSRRSRTAPTR